jgi:nitrate reductase NapE component
MPMLNTSLFSGLLVCQLIIDSLFNPWMLGICLIGAVGNLCWFFVLCRGAPGVDSRTNDIRSEEKSAIMSDLDKEIERRREIEKVEKN